MSPPQLKLRGEDADDLAVIAACLQDALARVDRMVFARQEGRFAAVFERFCWECAEPSPEGGAERRLMFVPAGLCFEEVREVKVRGIDQRDSEHPLELLTLAFEPGAEAAAPAPAVRLVFAGGGEIRLEVERLRVRLEDLGAPRPSRLVPRHPLDQEP